MLLDSWDVRQFVEKCKYPNSLPSNLACNRMSVNEEEALELWLPQKLNPSSGRYPSYVEAPAELAELAELEELEEAVLLLP